MKIILSAKKRSKSTSNGARKEYADCSFPLMILWSVEE